MRTLLLIDANSLIHRAFHALPPLTAKDGSPAQALYGVASILLKLWKENKPDYAAALFDRPEPTFRDSLYKDYKAQRPPTPDTLIPQLIAAKDLFQVFSVSAFDAPGFEADDMIATLAQRFREISDLRIVILTGDRDTLQLVEGDHIVVKSFRKGVSDTVIYDEPTVREQFSLAPSQVIDYKALVGDASDNIKGVAGIGPKTATELLQKFGSVEGIYEHAGEIVGATREKILAGWGAAREAKTLVTLRNDAPVIVTIENLLVQNGEEALRGYFETMGFTSLIKRMDGDGRLPPARDVKEPSSQKKARKRFPRTVSEHQRPLF